MQRWLVLWSRNFLWRTVLDAGGTAPAIDRLFDICGTLGFRHLHRRAQLVARWQALARQTLEGEAEWQRQRFADADNLASA
jgi:hypothetical protein